MALADLVVDVEPDGRIICLPPLPIHAEGMPASSAHHSTTAPVTTPAHYWLTTTTSDLARRHLPGHSPDRRRHNNPPSPPPAGMQSPSSVLTERHRNYSNRNCHRTSTATMDPPALDSALCRRDVAEGPRPGARPVPVSITASEFDRLGYKDEASSNIIRCIDHFYETKSGLDAARDLLRILQLREERIESTVEDAGAGASSARQDLRRPAGRPPPRRQTHPQSSSVSVRNEQAPLATPTSIEYEPKSRKDFRRRDSLTLPRPSSGSSGNSVVWQDEARQGGASTPLNLPTSAYNPSPMVTPQSGGRGRSCSFNTVASAANSEAAVAGPDVTPHAGGHGGLPFAPPPPRSQKRLMSTDLVLPLPGFRSGGGEQDGHVVPYDRPYEPQPRVPAYEAPRSPYQSRESRADDSANFSKQRVDLLMEYYRQIAADRDATEAERRAEEERPEAQEYPLPLKRERSPRSEGKKSIAKASKSTSGRRAKKKAYEGDSHDETASTDDTRGSESTPESGGSQDDSRASKMGWWRSRGGSRSSLSSQGEKDAGGSGASVTADDSADSSYKPKKSRSFRSSRLSSRQRVSQEDKDAGANCEPNPADDPAETSYKPRKSRSFHTSRLSSRQRLTQDPSATRSRSKRRSRRSRLRDDPSVDSKSTASTESVRSADSSSLESNFTDGFGSVADSRASSEASENPADNPASDVHSRVHRGIDDDLRRRMREQQRRRRAMEKDGRRPSTPEAGGPKPSSGKGRRGVNSFIQVESEAVARDAMDLVRHHVDRSIRIERGLGRGEIVKVSCLSS